MDSWVGVRDMVIGGELFYVGLVIVRREDGCVGGGAGGRVGGSIGGCVFGVLLRVFCFFGISGEL